MIKVKLNKEERKVINHIFLNGRVKRYSDIEGCNDRVNRTVDRCIKKGLLSYDDEGYIDFNYKKFPFFKTIKEKFSADIAQAKTQTGDNDKQFAKRMMVDNEFITTILNKALESGFDPKKELGIDLKKIKK